MRLSESTREAQIRLPKGRGKEGSVDTALAPPAKAIRASVKQDGGVGSLNTSKRLGHLRSP